MGIFGHSSTPAPPPPPPPPPAPASIASSAVSQAGTQQRAAAAARTGAGFDNTLATGPQGATPSGEGQKKLLGE